MYNDVYMCYPSRKRQLKNTSDDNSSEMYKHSLDIQQNESYCKLQESILNSRKILYTCFRCESKKGIISLNVEMSVPIEIFSPVV